jgi:hypothetical protein
MDFRGALLLLGTTAAADAYELVEAGFTVRWYERRHTMAAKEFENGFPELMLASLKFEGEELTDEELDMVSGGGKPRDDGGGPLRWDKNWGEN